MKASTCCQNLYELPPLAAKLRVERSFLCGTPALLCARVGRGNGFFVRARDRALCGLFSIREPMWV